MGFKLSRSQKFVKVQDFNCVQMRVSGCNDHYEFVLSAGVKAKSVTNNLPILSVLGGVFLLDLIFYHKAHNIYSFYKAKETNKAIFHYF